MEVTEGWQQLWEKTSDLVGVADEFYASVMQAQAPKIWGRAAILCKEDSSSNMTQLLLLGKFDYTGGPIFEVVLEC